MYVHRVPGQQGKEGVTERYKIFRSVDEINEMNESKLSWTATIDKISDMTVDERAI